MVESGHITVAIRDEVALVTLSRPEKLNALTGAMRTELAAILRRFGDGDSDGDGDGDGETSVRGIVLTGAGRAFSAGEDLYEAAQVPAGGMAAEIESFHNMTRAALAARVPVIAAINGLAVGGACELTLCFDARIGTEAAELFFPENNLGLTISNAASLLLPRLAGARAMRLIMDSARITARDALAFGLLDEITEQAALVGTAIGTIHRWTRPGAATAEHLRLLRPRPDDIERAFAAETEATRSTEQAGITQAGIGQFLRGRRRVT
ncbi:MAG TPA: enoyl-CoA hydratase/isomerase family protein [Streptosporangiaceae bacterium]|nr:enoyl-CoA hydratase/isomerase family protein [Streptosporangiaceae bacterium]